MVELESSRKSSCIISYQPFTSYHLHQATMGSSQSTPASPQSKVPEEAIHHHSQPPKADSSSQPFPVPTGHEYDAIDRIASELPNVIDDESRQQVEDYKQACDNGKGPMVRPSPLPAGSALSWPALTNSNLV